MSVPEDSRAESQINNCRTNESMATKRSCSPGMEHILHAPFPVLDHGFIRVVDYMGDDESITQAARVSYGRGTKKTSQDRNLIFYLMRHRHTTPFEMCEIKCHVKLPIFVARQWVRHRTASINEYSARYSVLDKEFYIPSLQHLASQSTQNNQGRSCVPLCEVDPVYADGVLNLLKQDSSSLYDHYEYLLNDKESQIFDPGRPGIARELARMNLSLNYYTQWYWKIDLHNLFHFLALRADPHSQYEIRAYADILLDIVKKWVPVAYDAFCEYRLNAASFSGTALNVIRRRLAGETVTQESSGLSKREWDEVNRTLPVA